MSKNALEVAQAVLAPKHGVQVAPLLRPRNRAVVYARYSSQKQKELSIEGQLRETAEYCERNHLCMVREPYIDRARSGRGGKRLAFQQMLEDAQAGAFDVIVIWKFNRFFRNLNQQSIVLEQLRQYGVEMQAVRDPLPEGKGGVYMRAFYGADAEVYSLDLAEATKRGMYDTAKQYKPTGILPLGYKASAQGTIELDHGAAKVVHSAFGCYANGGTMQDVCNIINAAGYRTAQGNTYSVRTITNVLRNVRYMGIYKYKDIMEEGKIPVIIPPDLFAAVHERLGVVKKMPQRGRAKEEYLLTGKLFCGKCGAPMFGMSGAGNGGKYAYYACDNRRKTHQCDKLHVTKEVMEEAVFRSAIDTLTEEMISTISVDAERQALQNCDNAKVRAALQEELFAVETELKNIAKAIGMGIITETTKAMLEDAEERRSDISGRLEYEQAVAQKAITAEGVATWLRSFKTTAENDGKMRKSVLKHLVQKAYAYDDGDGEGHVVVFCSLDGLQHMPEELFAYNETWGAKKPCKSNAYKAFFFFIYNLRKVGLI